VAAARDRHAGDEVMKVFSVGADERSRRPDTVHDAERFSVKSRGKAEGDRAQCVKAAGRPPDRDDVPVNLTSTG
jgi:hypothetical protein